MATDRPDTHRNFNPNQWQLLIIIKLFSGIIQSNRKHYDRFIELIKSLSMYRGYHTDSIFMSFFSKSSFNKSYLNCPPDVFGRNKKKISSRKWTILFVHTWQCRITNDSLAQIKAKLVMVKLESHSSGKMTQTFILSFGIT